MCQELGSYEKHFNLCFSWAGRKEIFIVLLVAFIILKNLLSVYFKEKCVIRKRLDN